MSSEEEHKQAGSSDAVENESQDSESVDLDEDIDDEDIGDEDIDDEDTDDEDIDEDITNSEEYSKTEIMPNTSADGLVEQKTDTPADISLKHLPMSISCHPRRNLLAIGSVEGSVALYTFGTDSENKEIVSFDRHKKSCRVVKFSDTGEHLFTGSQDTMIHVWDVKNNSVFREFKRVEGSALYSLLPIDNYLLAAGEENGEIVLWDFRVQMPLECFKESEDFISSLTMNREKKILIATSGDGTLSSCNIRAKKMMMRSEGLDCDLLSSGIFKGGKKLVVGAGDGSLNIFNWGEFGNISDRFPGHRGPVESLVVMEEDVICTGCEDSKVRVVQLFPNRFLGILGDHSGLPVDSVSLSFDKKLLVSSGYDHNIKFWDLSGVEELRNEDVKDTKGKHRQMNKKVDNFFEDLDD